MKIFVTSKARLKINTKNLKILKKYWSLLWPFPVVDGLLTERTDYDKK